MSGGSASDASGSGASASGESILSDRIALVTGASRGIGYHAALAYARAGAHVIAVARTVGGLEELDDSIRSETGSAATLVPLDLEDGEGIDRLGGSIAERWGRLDVLLGNAGILGSLSPVSHFDPSLMERVFSINVLANWRLIRSLDPLLRTSSSGRAIFVSSRAAHSCRAYWGAYCSSKAALEALVRSWASECEKTRLRVNLLDPGAVRTAMRAQAMPGEDPSTAASPESIAPVLVEMASSSCEENGKIRSIREGRYLSPRFPD